MSDQDKEEILGTIADIRCRLNTIKMPSDFTAEGLKTAITEIARLVDVTEKLVK